MSKKGNNILLLSLTVFLIATFSAAAEFEPLSGGARGPAMGNALSAAGGIDALLYNPAGIVSGSDGVMIANTDQFGLGIMQNYCGAKMTLAKASLGAAYSRLHDPELEYSLSTIQLTGAVPMPRNFSLGGSLRLGRLKSLGGSGKAVIGDLGLLWNPKSTISLGFVGQNLIAKTQYESTENDAPDGKFICGLGLNLPGRLFLSASTSLGKGYSARQLQFGVEKWYSSQLAVRAGYDGGKLAAGLTLKQGKLEFDYAYLPHNLGDTHRVALKYNLEGGIWK